MVKSNNQVYIADIGIRGITEYCISKNKHLTDYRILQIRDLTRYYGYIDFDAKQLTF